MSLSSSVPTTHCLDRTSQCEVRFAVADPKDVVMDVALHEDVRPTVLYST
jgi:hypothetical protein